VQRPNRHIQWLGGHRVQRYVGVTECKGTRGSQSAKVRGGHRVQRYVEVTECKGTWGSQSAKVRGGHRVKRYVGVTECKGTCLGGIIFFKFWNYFCFTSFGEMT
jgi:hypothetical protein